MIQQLDLQYKSRSQFKKVRLVNRLDRMEYKDT